MKNEKIIAACNRETHRDATHLDTPTPQRTQPPVQHHITQLPPQHQDKETTQPHVLKIIKSRQPHKTLCTQGDGASSKQISTSQDQHGKEGSLTKLNKFAEHLPVSNLLKLAREFDSIPPLGCSSTTEHIMLQSIFN